MTALVTGRPATPASHARRHRRWAADTGAARPARAVLHLSARLVRRGTLLMAAGIAAYVGVEIVSYRTAYPDGVSPMQFALFEDNPAVRMMQGVPTALDTAGGFMVWDGGWFIQLLLAVWAILVVTRLLRGEEDAERTDVLLAGPIRVTTATAATIVVLAVAGVGVAAAAAATLLALGQPVAGSLLFGAALAGVTLTFTGVGAVTSQLVDVRRRAAGLAAGVLGLAYVLRMVGNSTDPRSWVRWWTPLGWLDELEPFGQPDLRVLVPLATVPLALLVVAVLLRARRDAGGALLSRESGRRARLRWLGSPLGFAWRSNRAVLLAWVLGVAAYSAVMGALLATMVDWLAEDDSYQQIMAAIGMDAALTLLGFLAMMASMMGIAAALQGCWRIGAARAEEESGRAEVLLARPVSRVRWLGGHAILTLLGAVTLLAVSGVALWGGAMASGSDEIGLVDSLTSVLNTLPVVVLAIGVSVACLGLVPRLTVALPVTLVVVTYLVTMIGPALDWPAWVMNLSPFTHLAWVPLDPWAATSGTVMTLLGLGLCGLGLAAFRRRDLVGG